MPLTFRLHQHRYLRGIFGEGQAFLATHRFQPQRITSSVAAIGDNDLRAGRTKAIGEMNPILR